jgi:hypothetical protein
MRDRPKRRLEFWIARDQYESLLGLEEKIGAPIAAQIRIAIDEYLGKRGVTLPKERERGKHES